MAERTAWQTIKAQGGQMVDELRRLVHEGNVRRVVVKQRGRTVAEFPVTVGLVGALAAPALAAVGALVAVLADCSIDVERVGDSRVSGGGTAVRPGGRRSARPAASRARAQARRRTARS